MPSGRKPNLQRRRQVLRLRAQGLSLREIAKRFGVTKQAIWSLLHTRPRIARVRTVACTRCGGQIVSPGVLRRDAATAICVHCLREQVDPPFGQRLQALRLAAGLAQAELSRLTRISPGSIRAYEQGQRRPQRRTRTVLLRALDATLAHSHAPAG
jgi:transcriptional regulator with XRE-family HTH domain